MPNQRRNTAVASFLLKPGTAERTGLELEKLAGNERRIIEDRLNELIKKELESIRSAITAKLPEKEQLVRRIFAGIKKLKPSAIGSSSIADLVMGAFEDFKEPRFSEKELAAIREILAGAGDMQVRTLLKLDLPLKDNPLLAGEVKRARAFEYAAITGLGNDRAELLAARPVDLLNADETMMEELVRDNVVTEKQKEGLLVASRLARLTGENFGLMSQLSKEKIPEPSALIAMDSDDWLKLIKDKNITPPEEEDSAESYAATLRETVERSYPTEYYLSRTIKKEEASRIGKLAGSALPLLKNDVNLFSGNISRADDIGSGAWEGISAERQKKIKKELGELLPLVNRYRHLGIGEVIGKDMPAAEKQKEITRRVDTLDKFYKNNPALDIRVAGFTANSEIVKDDGFNWKGIGEKERPMVKKQMSAYQRTYILGGTEDVAGKLLDSAFDSAWDIVSLREEKFIEVSRLGVEKGREVYGRAVDLALGATHYFDSIRDGVRGNFKDIKVANQHPLVNDLREIDGFDKLFGSQDHCDCEHCRSIFSPAAYFTDLMFFIRDNITSNVFKGSLDTHPLNLKSRRPDLWELPLSCENTSTVIPYLDLVNEVLERYLKTTLSVPDAWQLLASSHLSVSQPVNLPLKELRTYLEHFGVTLEHLYRVMGKNQADQHREKLGLSPAELDIIVTPDPGGVRKRFGNRPLAKFPAQDFITYAGISRKELDDLVISRFLPQIAAVSVVMEPSGNDIQQYTEVISNLTQARLDLIHRYLRLWKKTPWTIREFDLVMNSFKEAGVIKNLGDTGQAGYRNILNTALAVGLQEKLKLSAGEVAALIHLLPDVAVEDNRKPLSERLFDPDKLSGTAEEKTPWILAGLSIPEADLPGLAAFLSIDLDGQTGEKELAALYRHARVARALKLSITDLLNALALVNDGNPLEGLAGIERLAEFAGWLRRSPFKTGELLFIITGNENPGKKYDINAQILAAKILEILNHETLEAAAGQAGKLQAAGQLLENYLLGKYNLTSGQFHGEYLPLLAPVPYDQAAAKALGMTFTGEDPDDISDLDDLLKITMQIERFSLLVSGHRLEPGNISFLLGNREAFGITGFNSLTVDRVRNITLFRDLLLEKDDFAGKLHEMLSGMQSTSSYGGHEEVMSELWGLSPALIGSLSSTLAYTGPALDAVRHFRQALEICDKLGIQGDSLLRLAGNDYRAASQIALGAFKSKYGDEKERLDKLEPYTDRINTFRRDALCDYIISREDKFRFKSRNDLYAFFLLSVDMDGCGRTSRLVAAISSLQLYIHRCLVNLEQSDPYLNPGLAMVKVSPTLIPAGEWEWRKNYRVWEANRKVFLYPENYIDPTLRNTKTHIFKELEDELLQQKITSQSAEDAYKKYMAGFGELTRLRYAGGYYHRVYDNHGFLSILDKKGSLAASSDATSATGSGGSSAGSIGSTASSAGASGLGSIAGIGNSSIGSVGATAKAYFMVNTIYFPRESDDSHFYLFARTNVMPYQYYYRTYNDNKKVWGNWEKIELTIEAAEISALVHLGRLYIFWSESKSKEESKLQDGSSSSEGFIFTGYVKYSVMNENGKWSAPQRLMLGEGSATSYTVFKRARNNNPFSSSRWDKEKDAIVEKFERLVFRKPYAYRNSSDKTYPVGLGLMWTANVFDQTLTYTTRVYNLNMDYGILKLKFTVPSRTFTIINGDFSNPAVTTRNLTVSVRVSTIVAQPFNVNFSGTLSIHHGVCLFTSSATVFVIGIPVPVFIVLPVAYDTAVTNHAARENSFQLSLSRNQIGNPTEMHLFGTGSLNFYQKEYEQAFSESGNFSAHIEHGERVLSSHKIFQDRNGTAHLEIRRGNLAEAVPASTILTDELTDVLYAKGIEQFLALPTQQVTDQYGQMFDFEGPYGEYYREIFFHIPFTIANHFNANQKFREAKWWYERIFNPTSEETPSDTNPTDHNWQYREFRGLTPERLRDILSDTTAIEVYKKDPFDPHAIARLRISAYQKAIVMKYVDNLLDWGDHLFTQDTRESINEAEMLYQTASDILGTRPVKMGRCKTADENTLTWEKLSGPGATGTDFLITLENYFWTRRERFRLETGFVKGSKALLSLSGNSNSQLNFAALEPLVSIRKAGDLLPFLSNAAMDAAATGISPGTAPGTTPGATPGSRAGNTIGSNAGRFSGNITGDSRTGSISLIEKYDMMLSYKDVVFERRAGSRGMKDLADKTGKDGGGIDFGDLKYRPQGRMPSFDVVRQSSLAFCVPENKDLLGYWDRVEDRLFKIWNCMNIKGIRRSLSLFQPPIDPMMLVRARASGLSLEDAVAMAVGASLPHYRFTYLVEKARQFAQVTQAFGTALLSALEKKDSEELLRLRTVHEKNILKMTTAVRKKQVQEALAQVNATREGQRNVENRVDYYSSLVETGLIPWEVVEQVSKWTASGIRIGEATLGFLSSVFGFLPQVGSPFSMKYGGLELSSGTRNLANATGTLAAIADNVAILAGLEAGHQRREQEWKQQLKLSEQELRQVSQQLVATQIRHQLSEHELEIHERNIEQVDELDDFYKNKFTNLGLYNYMASSLNRIYRSAYNISLEMARMAERAYQFETYRGDVFIRSDNWQFDRAGLLSGEKLMQQLQEMEREWISNNERIPEITQNFSLALLDPSRLVALRQTGSCEIAIPEVAFEVMYPGQYRRTIKSVRVTIPCIAGPYTNISARLTLLRGEIETEDGVDLIELDVAKNTSITTSSANNDSGVFELNFRDERYLPFEGAGAVSLWRLELPEKIRAFNYDTISDVILHLSYTALDGDRAAAGNELADLIEDHAATHGLYRLFSLRHDFPVTFNRLTASGSVQLTFTTEITHFPYFLGDKVLVTEQVKVLVKPVKGEEVQAPQGLKIGGTAVSWSSGDDIALPGVAGNTGKIRGGTVAITGSPVRDWTIEAGSGGLDDGNIEDILILVRYKIA